MDKAFFDSFDERRLRFAERAGYQADDVQVQVILGNGRVYLLAGVVEAADTWLHLDVREMDDQALRSVMLPYYQVHHVLFQRERSGSGLAGFAR
jgi:hypothetical protein